MLVHLENATAVFVLGSTEPHYTPSKVYQGILAEKPILAVLHKDSTAADVIIQSNAGIVLTFNGMEGLNQIHEDFSEKMMAFKNLLKSFKAEQINTTLFNQYSAHAVTQKLASLLKEAVNK